MIIVSFSGCKQLGLDERTAFIWRIFFSLILASCDKKLQSCVGSTTDNWCYIKMPSICTASAQQHGVCAQELLHCRPCRTEFWSMTLLLKASRSRPVRPLRRATQRRIMKTQQNGLRKPASANLPYYVTVTVMSSVFHTCNIRWTVLEVKGDINLHQPMKWRKWWAGSTRFLCCGIVSIGREVVTHFCIALVKCDVTNCSLVVHRVASQRGSCYLGHLGVINIEHVAGGLVSSLICTHVWGIVE